MLKNYLKIAWRNLWKNKAFSAINIAGLTIGMASAALILLWVQNELSFDRGYPKKDRIYVAYNRAKFDGKLWCWATTPKILGPTIKADYPQVEDVARYNQAGFLFTYGDRKLNISGGFTDPGFLNVFDFTVLKGDAKTALKDNYSIAVTQKMAKKLFGTEDVIGKVVKIDSNANFTVTALLKDLPNNTSFNFDYLLPWSYMKQIKYDDDYWGNNSVATYVLLKPGVNIDAFNKQVKNITRSHSKGTEENEVFLWPADKWHLYAKFVDGKNTGGYISTVRQFAAIALFILLIACINFMNLSTARSEKRAKEVGIRKVAGAPRRLLIGQFLGESIIIAAISGVIALIVVLLSLPAFNTLTQKELSLSFNNPVFWLSLISFILITGIVAGSYPAFYLSSFKPVSVLKGTFKAANALITPRKLLVIMQFTFATIFVIYIIVIKRQIDYAQQRDNGYKKDNLVYTMMTGEISKHYNAIREDLINSGAAVGVTKTGSPITQRWSDSWGVDWSGKQPGSKIDFVIFNSDGNFVKTLGLKVAQGRDIDMKTFPTDSSAAVLNEAAAKAMGFKNPIGQLIKKDDHTWHIVGVVQDFIIGSPYEPVSPMIIQGPASWFNVIHYKLNPAHSTAQNLKLAEDVFKKYNPDYPFEYKFVDEDYAEKFKNEQKLGTLGGLFAGLTIFISCLGLFGLATYMAQNRMKEIGVRKVLGASVTRITTLLSFDFLKLVLISFAIAAPIAWLTMREWLNSYSYRITIGAGVFLAAGTVTIVLALATVSFQAIKAATSNPVKSLRSE
ncbi:ABC transporter permease [Mucilaginibacter sp. KACC 22063]|uniref:ABC transporter permease n=1 Tax=Mucilaginibacter sp. KACC 22063 TaxID=3025666 RepID=UPI00236604C3|nr:ABC transporter permease [Mucilaginibacter sp. KACC 22063]WDF53434.1 ABC transporter permease [Mucilaginibacter sp. KACC 22063]